MEWSAGIPGRFLVLLSLGSAASAVPQGVHDSFVNPSFALGLEGWNPLETRRREGLAFADGQLGTLDLTALGGDPSAAGLAVWVRAGELFGTAPPGSRAHARVELRQKLDGIPSTLLSFDWMLGFGTKFQADGTSAFRARLVVRSSSPASPEVGPELVFVFADALINLGEACGVAAAAEGFREYQRVTLDLAEAGFIRGDSVEVLVELEASVLARSTCDYADFLGQLVVDRFRIERLQAQPAPRPPGDASAVGLPGTRR